MNVQFLKRSGSGYPTVALLKGQWHNGLGLTLSFLSKNAHKQPYKQRKPQYGRYYRTCLTN